MEYNLTIKCADFEQKSNINSNFEFNSKISEESPIYTCNDHTQSTGLESNTNSNIHFNTITHSNSDIHITENSASDIPQLSLENISTDILSTECTVTSSNLQKNNINHSNSSMNSQSSFDTRRISIASELSSVKENCNSTVKNKQFMILTDVRHIIASNLEKVKRLEKENKDIPIMRKRLDHLETELMLRNLTPLYEDSTQTSKDTSSTQYTPALLLSEIYTALNCQGAIENLTNNTIESEILNDNNNNININNNNNNNNNTNILTSIRKIVLKRINLLKKLELKSSAIQHNTTDKLIKQISLLTSKSEEIDTKLINCRNYVNTVTSLKDEISRKENSYFKKYFEKLLSPNNKSKTSTSDQRIIELELKCKQFQIKLSQYRDTIMLDNTENETLAAQLQPYKAAAQTSIALYDEAKIVRSNLEAKETINAQLLNEINRLNETLETNTEMENIENKKKIELLNNKNEEEIEILNQQLIESKNRSSNLSDSINKLTIMMSEHKHRNNELQTEVEDLKKNLETELDVKSNLDAEVTSLTKKLHHTENEYDKLLRSQQNIDLLNDNLRIAGQEICQHKKNSEQLFSDNTQLNSKIEYENIKNFLTDGSYPTYITSYTVPSKEEGNFRRKCSSFNVAEDAKLCKKTALDGNEVILEVAKRSQVFDLLKRFHDNVGHPGIQYTVKAIQKQYYWLGIYKEVADYIKTCTICQMTAPLLPAPQRKLQPIPPPNRPWKHIGMDLIQDLPESPEGYKHVLVTVCYLSKYVVVRPLKRKTSEEVIENLKDIYLEFGLPDVIQHDQGKEFKSASFQEFHDKIGVDNRSTRAYHPMANGLVEAHNKVLKMKLSRLVIETGKHWSMLLKSAVLAMNSTHKRSHGRTAFKIMWGRESRHEDLLSYLNKCKFSNENDLNDEHEIINDVGNQCNIEYQDISYTCQDVLEESLAIMEESLEMERSNAALSIRKEQSKQKKQFDKRVTEKKPSIKKDDKILYTNMPKLKKMPKTKEQSKYIGPYTVSEVTDSHIILSKEELCSKKDKKVPIHIAKTYYDRSSDVLKKTSRKRKASEDKLENNSKKIKDASKQLIYGFSKCSLMNHIDDLKEILKQNISSNTFMTPLHLELHQKRNIAHQYTPNSCFLKFLNDTTPDDMKIYIRETLENWVEELYPEYSDALKMKYADKVLYSVAFEYLNTILWETLSDYQYANPIHKDDPKISVITEKWQREKCVMLGLEFNSTLPQPINMVGRNLSLYKPLDTVRIRGDGNCLYRCLSTLITGSQESHSQVRSTIARFIASEGTTQMCNFFKTKTDDTW